MTNGRRTSRRRPRKSSVELSGVTNTRLSPSPAQAGSATIRSAQASLPAKSGMKEAKSQWNRESGLATPRSSAQTRARVSRAACAAVAIASLPLPITGLASRAPAVEPRHVAAEGGQSHRRCRRRDRAARTTGMHRARPLRENLPDRQTGRQGGVRLAVATDIGVMTPDPASKEPTLTALQPGATVAQLLGRRLTCLKAARRGCCSNPRVRTFPPLAAGKEKAMLAVSTRYRVTLLALAAVLATAAVPSYPAAAVGAALERIARKTGH